MKRSRRAKSDRGDKCSAWPMGYMNAKIRKLESQFEDAAEQQSNIQSSIFQGISVFVNGLTDPPSDEIRRLMLKHGGTFQHYQRRGARCYVIASQLAKGKANNTRDRIVHPNWIVDSIRAGKLLSVNDYIVYEKNGIKGQKRLTEMKTIGEKDNALRKNYQVNLNCSVLLNRIEDIVQEDKYLNVEATTSCAVDLDVLKSSVQISGENEDDQPINVSKFENDKEHHAVSKCSSSANNDNVGQQNELFSTRKTSTATRNLTKSRSVSFELSRKRKRRRLTRLSTLFQQSDSHKKVFFDQVSDVNGVASKASSLVRDSISDEPINPDTEHEACETKEASCLDKVLEENSDYTTTGIQCSQFERVLESTRLDGVDLSKQAQHLCVTPISKDTEALNSFDRSSNSSCKTDFVVNQGGNTITQENDVFQISPQDIDRTVDNSGDVTREAGFEFSDPLPRTSNKEDDKCNNSSEVVAPDVAVLSDSASVKKLGVNEEVIQTLPVAATSDSITCLPPEDVEFLEDSLIPSVKNDLIDKDVNLADRFKSEPFQKTYTVSNKLSATSVSTFDRGQSSDAKVVPKTASDAGFLEEFYKRSRLHHIATQRTKLQQYVRELRENHSGDFAGRLELIKWMEDKAVYQNDALAEDERETIHDRSPVIIHIDMDCFFVSVGIRDKPELKDKPVAVCHAEGTKQRSVSTLIDFRDYNQWTHKEASTSEIASCSYAARKYGVHSGMLLGKAKALCPKLVTIPYDFEAYDEVTKVLYDVVASLTLTIEAVSCDELYADMSDVVTSTGASPLDLAEFLRTSILSKSRCTASVGLGSNMLMARLANRACKPNGKLYVSPHGASQFLHNIPVGDLPGVGWQTVRMLASSNVKTCEDLQRLSLPTLREMFGPTLGQNLHNLCRGIDKRPLREDSVRKIVSAEVNYGIRFGCSEEASRFVGELASEVHRRLCEAKMAAHNVRLKVLIRAKNAPKEPMKYLGCGHCDAVSRSTNFRSPIVDNSEPLLKACGLMLSQMKLEPTDIRGMGIQLTKLVQVQVAPTTALDRFLIKGYTRKSTVENTNLKKETNRGLLASTTISRISDAATSSLVQPKLTVSPRPSTSAISDHLEEQMDLDGVLEDSISTFKSVGPKKLELLRRLLKKWTSSNEYVSADVESWRSALEAIVEDNNLCAVRNLLSILHCVACSKECWQSVYVEIVSGIQPRVVALYGYPLDVPLGFRNL